MFFINIFINTYFNLIALALANAKTTHLLMKPDSFYLFFGRSRANCKDVFPWEVLCPMWNTSRLLGWDNSWSAEGGPWEERCIPTWPRSVLKIQETHPCHLYPSRLLQRTDTGLQSIVGFVGSTTFFVLVEASISTTVISLCWALVSCRGTTEQHQTGVRVERSQRKLSPSSFGVDKRLNQSWLVWRSNLEAPLSASFPVVYGSRPVGECPSHQPIRFLSAPASMYSVDRLIPISCVFRGERYR